MCYGEQGTGNGERGKKNCGKRQWEGNWFPFPRSLFPVVVAVLACKEPATREAKGDVGIVLPTTHPTVATPDADVNRAQAELAEGRPTVATRIVMPVLRTPERRTPEAQLVAARAAAAW